MNARTLGERGTLRAKPSGGGVKYRTNLLNVLVEQLLALPSPAHAILL